MAGRVHIGGMSEAPTIEIRHSREGALTYWVSVPPDALPPVRGRDIAAVWEAARDAAADALWGDARLFRFHRQDGSTLDLALSDEDARCWAGAVDEVVGMQSSYGLSLCLRLLALVDLLGRAAWLSALCQIGRTGATLHPSLLQAAATLKLTPEARFDETQFRARLYSLSQGLPRLALSGDPTS